MVNEKINNYLFSKGISINTIAHRAGIEPAIMFSICAGARPISVIEYYRICQALRVPLRLFLEG